MAKAAKRSGVRKEPAALVNRKDLAELFRVTLPTVDEYRKSEDFPSPIVEGSNGKEYQYDLAACRDWYLERQKRIASQASAKADAIKAVQAELDLADGGGADSVASLPFKQRQEFYAAELAGNKARMARGELVEAKAVEAEFESVLSAVARFLQTLPDQLARDLALEPGVVGALQEKIDEHQAQLARALMSRKDLAEDAA